MRNARLLLAFAVASGLFLSPRTVLGVASGWAVNGPSKVRLITPWKVAPLPGETRLGIHFLLQPGWHVYWKNSGDAGYPPALTLTGSPAPASAELLWPAPHRFELPGGLVAFGYEREAVYPVRVRFIAGSPTAAMVERWQADLDYLVCQIDCIPFKSRLTVDQPLAQPAPDSRAPRRPRENPTRRPRRFWPAPRPSCRWRSAIPAVPANLRGSRHGRAS
ncbi:MAG TPA: protein-disulfide reductase DsbD domain-containing protein, partial [Thermoanaerobaculia bacterium]|nr:protein-disulfide reductase DsbD domain-containing protein [Thermoanaerobaculia bacterium]